MSLKIAFQKTVILLSLGSFHEAMATPLSEWEGSFIENESEESIAPPRGFVDDVTRTPMTEDVTPELVEVAVAPKRQALLQNRSSHKDLAMVPVASSGGQNIKDETATTGENAKKQLPFSVKSEQMQSPYLHQINQVVPHLISMDSR